MEVKTNENGGSIFVYKPSDQEVMSYSDPRALTSSGELLKVTALSDNNYELTDKTTSERTLVIKIGSDNWRVGEKVIDNDQRAPWDLNKGRNRVESLIRDQVEISLFWTMRHSMETSYQYDLEMGEEKPARDLIKDEGATMDRELWTDVENESGRYLAALKNKGVRLENTKYKVGDGTSVNIITIGKSDIGQIETIAKLVQIMNEYKSNLNLNLPKELTVMEFFDFEDQSHVLRETGTANMFSTASCTTDIFRTVGFTRKSDNLIVFAPVGQRTITGESKVDLNFLYIVARHELAHFMDVWLRRATFTQREGFARMCEVGSNFEIAKKRLRRNYNYTNKVTVDKLISTLNEPDPSSNSNFVKPEKYDISGSFFCFLYEKLGAKKFMNFYGLLTGGLVLDERKIVDYESASSKVFADDSIRDVVHALKIVTIGQEVNQDALIKEYIKRINSN